MASLDATTSTGAAHLLVNCAHPDHVATRDLASALPGVSIVGRCCGTDARHVAAMWDGWSPVGRPRTG